MALLRYNLDMVDMVDYSEQHITSTRRLDGIALWLLLFGGPLFVIPWIIGVFMVWRSPRNCSVL